MAHIRSEANPCILFAIICALLCEGVANADSELGLDYAGLLDLRLAAPDGERGWQEGGFGKVRYGAGRSEPVVRIPEAALLLMPYYGWNLSGYIHLKADADQEQLVDLVEGYITYKPVPVTENRYRLRTGLFYPPVSLENTGLAWTSPYSITPSAINTWIGEETRGYGVEASWLHEVGENRLSLTGAVVWGTDKAGTVLYRRGWALHDFKPAIGDNLPVPVPASLPLLPNTSRSMIEIDERPGYYLAVNWKDLDGGQIRLMYYDNQTDPSSVEGQEKGWETSFSAVGLKWPLGKEVELISQYIHGNSQLDTPGVTKTETSFDSAFLLLSRLWADYRLTGRIDWFEVEDEYGVSTSNLGEDGWALTIAGQRNMGKGQSIWLELLNIHSRRPSRATVTRDEKWHELILQANYRIEFR